MPSAGHPNLYHVPTVLLLDCRQTTGQRSSGSHVLKQRQCIYGTGILVLKKCVSGYWIPTCHSYTCTCSLKSISSGENRSSTPYNEDRRVRRMYAHAHARARVCVCVHVRVCVCACVCERVISYMVTSQGWTTPGCQSRSCLRRALTRGPAMDPSVVGEMWQLQSCVRPVSRRRNGTTLLRTGGTGASVAVGSNQASPNQECSSVSAAATFAVRMIYPDTRTTASPNSYHRLRRWAFQRSKGVCVCVRACDILHNASIELERTLTFQHVHSRNVNRTFSIEQLHKELTSAHPAITTLSHLWQRPYGPSTVARTHTQFTTCGMPGTPTIVCRACM